MKQSTNPNFECLIGMSSLEDEARINFLWSSLFPFDTAKLGRI